MATQLRMGNSRQLTAITATQSPACCKCISMKKSNNNNEVPPLSSSHYAIYYFFLLLLVAAFFHVVLHTFKRPRAQFQFKNDHTLYQIKTLKWIKAFAHEKFHKNAFNSLDFSSFPYSSVHILFVLLFGQFAYILSMRFFRISVSQSRIAVFFSLHFVKIYLSRQTMSKRKIFISK